MLARYLQTAEQGGPQVYPTSPCHCLCHEHGGSRSDSLSDHADIRVITRPPPSTTTVDSDPHIIRRDTSPANPLSPIRTDTYPASEDTTSGLGIHSMDSNSPTGATRALIRIATALGTASADRFDDQSFRQGKATGFPEVPGEGNRNSRLSQNRQLWGDDLDDCLTPRGGRSRANSFNGSIYRSHSASRAPSPQPRQRSQTTGPGIGTSSLVLGLPPTHSPESTSEPIFPARPSAELVPVRSATIPVITLHEGPGSPAIVLSVEDGLVEEPVEVSVSIAVSSSQPERPAP